MTEIIIYFNDNTIFNFQNNYETEYFENNQHDNKTKELHIIKINNLLNNIEEQSDLKEIFSNTLNKDIRKIEWKKENKIIYVLEGEITSFWRLSELDNTSILEDLSFKTALM